MTATLGERYDMVKLKFPCALAAVGAALVAINQTQPIPLAYPNAPRIIQLPCPAVSLIQAVLVLVGCPPSCLLGPNPRADLRIVSTAPLILPRLAIELFPVCFSVLFTSPVVAAVVTGIPRCMAYRTGQRFVIPTAILGTHVHVRNIHTAVKALALYGALDGPCAQLSRFSIFACCCGEYPNA